MGRVSVTREIGIESHAVLRDHAKLGRERIQLEADLLKILKDLSMLVSQFLMLPFMMTVDLTQRFDLGGGGWSVPPRSVAPGHLHVQASHGCRRRTAHPCSPDFCAA